MTDIALRYDADAGWDIAIAGGDLATDDGLQTAIILSLFTDRRARDDDTLPQPGADRRGWWGDCANDDPNDLIGSRLWLLQREKLLPATALRARDICQEALDWLIADGLVVSIDVQTSILPPSAANPTGAMAIGVTTARPDGPARQRYDFVWDATARSFAVA